MRDALGTVQRVLVLGGGSDIGRAIAHALVAERARLVVLGVRDPAAATALAGAEQLRRAGADDVALLPFDAGDCASHEATIGSAFARYGDLDVVVLAAGVLGDQPRALREPALAAEVMRVNLVGAGSALLVAARRLREQGHGTLVVLSSVAAVRPRRANFVYGASKAGLDALARGLGDELAADGIGVMVVRPGFVRTKMTAGLPPAPLATTPEAVAALVVAGLRRGADAVWAPRAARAAALALRLAPRALLRRSAR
ncbi:MAG TPA: SDR family NAD(P)-dependent oxidoreductase [Conexibacter sp.]